MDHKLPIIHEFLMTTMHCLLNTDIGLFIWGYNSEGRLGTGAVSQVISPKSEKRMGAQVTPFLVPFLPEMSRVCAIAAGKSHSIVCLDNGHVWVWGCNQLGQCGLSSLIEFSTHSSGEIPQMHDIIPPQRLARGPLKRESIIGAAASDIHSCVYNRSSLFTFGLNKGQLGALKDFMIVPPHQVSLLPQEPIQMATCTEIFTCVLFDSGDVWMLQDFSAKRLLFRLKKQVNSLTKLDSGWKTSQPCSHLPISLIRSSESKQIAYGCAVSTTGSVFLWASHKNTQGNSSSKVFYPTVVWGVEKQQHRVIDAAVNGNGQVIVCCEMGKVYLSTPIQNATELSKVTWFKVALDQVSRVYCNGNGSFCAMKSNAVQTYFEKTLENDMHQWPSHAESSDSQHSRSSNIVFRLNNRREILKFEEDLLMKECAWLRAASSSPWRDHQSCIDLSYFDEWQLEALLQWCSKKGIALTYQELIKFLEFADYLLLDGLKDDIEKMLSKCIYGRTVCFLLQASHKMNASRLKNACLEFLVRNTEFLFLQMCNFPDQTLLQEIEKHVKVQQTKYCTYARSMAEKSVILKFRGNEFIISEPRFRRKSDAQVKKPFPPHLLAQDKSVTPIRSPNGSTPCNPSAEKKSLSLLDIQQEEIKKNAQKIKTESRMPARNQGPVHFRDDLNPFADLHRSHSLQADSISVSKREVLEVDLTSLAVASQKQGKKGKLNDREKTSALNTNSCSKSAWKVVSSPDAKSIRKR
jgi:alpha-tubulin suppressor-like RCC1 family protein